MGDLESEAMGDLESEHKMSIQNDPHINKSLHYIIYTLYNIYIMIYIYIYYNDTL